MSFLSGIGEGLQSAFGGKNAIQGALIGGGLMGGGGSVGGLLLGAQMDVFDRQANAQLDAQRKAEKLRVQQVMKEFGRKQQADSVLLTGLARSNSSQTRTSAGTSVPQSGLIGNAVGGANGSAGTF